MPQEKSLLEMTEWKIFHTIHNATGCLVCGKAISYKILGSRFCYECNRKYSKEIQALLKKSRVMRTEEGGLKRGKIKGK